MKALPDGLVLVAHEGVIACDKPAGLPSTGRTVDDPRCLQSLLIERLRRRRVWAVHQLDQDTSGINLFVLRRALVEIWRARLARGEKTYLALVRGSWTEGERMIDARIGRVGGVPSISSDGKVARTHVRPLAIAREASALEVRIETGRTHQVRVHLASVGHPLLGERLHASCDRAPRHALHAWRLRLEGAPAPLAELEAPVPRDLFDVAVRFGLGAILGSR